MPRHHEIDDWLEHSLEVLETYESFFGPTAIDADLLEAVEAGRLTPEEAEQCRADYLSQGG